MRGNPLKFRATGGRHPRKSALGRASASRGWGGADRSATGPNWTPGSRDSPSELSSGPRTDAERGCRRCVCAVNDDSAGNLRAQCAGRRILGPQYDEFFLLLGDGGQIESSLRRVEYEESIGSCKVCLWMAFAVMDQHSRNAENSGSESLSYSLEYSEPGSLAESVGSAEFESSSSRELTPTREPRQNRKSGQQFLEFSKQLPDVPVAAAWEFIRDHRNLSNIAPGVIAHFDYLEGDGSTGSVFIANYTPQYNPDEKYVVNKVEVRNDADHMYAVRCVGGRYQKRYHLYFTFIKVVPDEVLGDSSSVIIWRLQYELIDPQNAIPHETKMGYTAAMDLIRDQHLVLNRVQRPLVSQALLTTMMKRLKRQALQRRIGAEHRQSGEPSKQRRKPWGQLLFSDDKERVGQKKQKAMRKSRVQLLGEDDEEVDRDVEETESPRRKVRGRLQVKEAEGVDRD